MESRDSLDASQTRNLDIQTQLQRLRERINEDSDGRFQKLKSSLETLKAVERQESEFQSNCNAKRSELEAEITALEEKSAAGGCDCNTLSDHLSQSVEGLNLAKRELAARLRDVLSIKRQLGDVPSHLEITQYECRFSELYALIQEKHQKTQKYYATYNALLEIKELMLKEASLLNSISSQFQDAITSSDGRMKLIDSMEKIVKGNRQKLEKVQVGLREEQKACDMLKERYAVALAEQRRCRSLLKAFQEECAKNEKLRSQSQGRVKEEPQSEDDRSVARR